MFNHRKIVVVSLFVILLIIIGCKPDHETHAIYLPWVDSRDAVQGYYLRTGSWPKTQLDVKSLCGGRVLKDLELWDMKYRGGFDLVSVEPKGANYRVYSRTLNKSKDYFLENPNPEDFNHPGGKDGCVEIKEDTELETDNQDEAKTD